MVLIAVLGSEPGVRKAAAEGLGKEGGQEVDVWIGGLDDDVNDRGMIKPGIGDIGDRLFLTIGK